MLSSVAPHLKLPCGTTSHPPDVHADGASWQRVRDRPALLLRAGVVRPVQAGVQAQPPYGVHSERIGPHDVCHRLCARRWGVRADSSRYHFMAYVSPTLLMPATQLLHPPTGTVCLSNTKSCWVTCNRQQLELTVNMDGTGRGSSQADVSLQTNAPALATSTSGTPATLARPAQRSTPVALTPRAPDTSSCPS